jgi:hypothetical protein
MVPTLAKLQNDFPSLAFEPSQTFYWSPKANKVFFKIVADNDEVATWSLLHEVGHALLEHQVYESDFELLNMEVQAWAKAEKLAKDYGVTIDPGHVQDCLDTYRDWLYQRSTCPTCMNCSLQTNNRTYQCFNCGTVWHVSASRMCRPYRRKAQITNSKLQNTNKFQ